MSRNFRINFEKLNLRKISLKNFNKIWKVLNPNLELKSEIRFVPQFFFLFVLKTLFWRPPQCNTYIFGKFFVRRILKIHFSSNNFVFFSWGRGAREPRKSVLFYFNYKTQFIYVCRVVVFYFRPVTLINDPYIREREKLRISRSNFSSKGSFKVKRRRVTDRSENNQSSISLRRLLSSKNEQPPPHSFCKGRLSLFCQQSI